MIYFGYYLAERGLVTAAQVLEALERQHSERIPIGEFARRTGKLTDEQVLSVLNRQESDKEKGVESKPFGQIAQEMGLLNEQDILALLEENRLVKYWLKWGLSTRPPWNESLRFSRGYPAVADLDTDPWLGQRIPVRQEVTTRNTCGETRCWEWDTSGRKMFSAWGCAIPSAGTTYTSRLE